MMYMVPIGGTRSWGLVNEWGGLPPIIEHKELLAWLDSIGADYKTWAYMIEFFDPKIELLVRMKHPEIKIPIRLHLYDQRP